MTTVMNSIHYMVNKFSDSDTLSNIAAKCSDPKLYKAAYHRLRAVLDAAVVSAEYRPLAGYTGVFIRGVGDLYVWDDGDRHYYINSDAITAEMNAMKGQKCE